MSSHISLVQQMWAYHSRLASSGDHIVLDGASLNLAAVVAVCRESTKAHVQKSSTLVERLENSVKALSEQLRHGDQIYGVNTGCGGNANTRTEQLQVLQHAFFQHHQAGILPELAMSKDSSLQDMNEGNHSLAPEVVRGVIMLRCNSLLRGHSAVRLEIIELLLRVLNEGYVPLIPQRGSISASGDLSPLSYLGGLIEGNDDVFVQFMQDGTRKVVSAAEMLQRIGVRPTRLNAKEGLGVMNGTAVSTAAAALALYDSHHLALLVQGVTAMATEALLGTVDNYHEFISCCRPHPGQTEVARNIRMFLRGSKLCQETDVNKIGLVQDRYALRTAPQWIGPQLEDLLSATRQIDVELNSTTDNPLIDVEESRFHHGGNFQAASVTSAMEKCRSALVMLGRLVLSQCGELTNPDLSKGLPANLALDDVSKSFAVKGLDINMTAYYSELAFLGNSVANHVHSAEMSNQSVNSLALVSARYTSQCVQVLSMMCAAHLYILCQALDIRALTMDFLTVARKDAEQAYGEIFGGTRDQAASDFGEVWAQILPLWHDTGDLDLKDRCNRVASMSFGHVLEKGIQQPTECLPSFCSNAQKWKSRLRTIFHTRYCETCDRFVQNPSTCCYLGLTSKAIYMFIRNDLRIPLHQGVKDHPPYANEANPDQPKRTIGSYVSQIYVAIREGRLVAPMMDVGQ